MARKKDTRLDLDEAVKYLRKYPDEIIKAWMEPYAHVAGRLFDFVQPYPLGTQIDYCGCPVMIQEGFIAATKNRREDKQLTAYIRGLKLPEPNNITVRSLPKFAAAQKYIDSYYREKGWR